jgi:hypothetical protein
MGDVDADVKEGRLVYVDCRRVGMEVEALASDDIRSVAFQPFFRHQRVVVLFSSVAAVIVSQYRQHISQRKLLREDIPLREAEER